MSEDTERSLEQDRDTAYAVLRKLVEALPKCNDCLRPATRAFNRGAWRWCDKHGVAVMCDLNMWWVGPREAPEYPRAEALREAMKLLGME